MKGAAAAALAACLIAGACSCTAAGPSDAQEVRVLVAGDPEELEVYRALVEGFHEAQDEVRVRLEEAPDRDVLLAQLATAIAAGRPPDVFLLNYRYTGRFISTDAVLALEDRLAASSVLSEDAFYRTPLEAFQADGRQMCLPQNAASLVVYWNEDLFEAAGVEAPSDDWTWDEMVGAAAALTTDDDGDGAPDVYGVGVDPEILRLAPLIWSAGGELVDDDDAPTTFALRSAAALGAIRRFLELRVVHGVTPTEEEAESEDHVTRFSSGRLGMLMESRRVVPSIRAGATFAWDVAPFPILDEPATVLHSDGYCITSASARPDAAWTFVEYALGPEGQRITAEAGRTVPSLIEVAESDAFVDPSTMPPSSEVYLDQLDVARPVPATAAWPRVEDTANAILEEAYYESSQRAEAGEVALSIIRATSGMFTEGAS
jgi:multiple sugar transport system substrate-binding protein